MCMLQAKHRKLGMSSSRNLTNCVDRLLVVELVLKLEGAMRVERMERVERLENAERVERERDSTGNG